MPGSPSARPSGVPCWPLRRLAQRLLRMRSRHRPPSPSRSQAPGQPPATTLDRIGVTGSNIRRTDTETASPVQVVTRQEIERTGKATVAEYLQTLTSDGSGSVPKTFGAGFASGSAAISLRGPGAGSTLVLPNGRRKAPFGLADDGQKVFTDPSTIPMEAVERVGPGAEHRRQSAELEPVTYTDTGNIIALGCSACDGDQNVVAAHADMLAPCDLAGAVGRDAQVSSRRTCGRRARWPAFRPRATAQRGTGLSARVRTPRRGWPSTWSPPATRARIRRCRKRPWPSSSGAGAGSRRLR